MKLQLRQKLIQEGIMDGLQLYIQNKYNDLKNFIETDKIKEAIDTKNINNAINSKDAKVIKDIKDQNQGTTDASLPNVG